MEFYNRFHKNLYIYSIASWYVNMNIPGTMQRAQCPGLHRDERLLLGNPFIKWTFRS